MNLEWTQVLVAGIWGGLLAVERRAFLQAMISRPLVAATVMGLLLGDVASGLYVGMLLELFHLGSANLGAALPENETLVSTGTAAAAAAMARSAGAGGTPAIWALAILGLVGLGRLGRLVDRSLEPYSGRLAHKALAEAEQGDLERAVRQNLWGMWPVFLVFGALTAACAIAGGAVGPLLGKLPPSLMRGLAGAFPAMASVAAAIAARNSHARRAPLFAGVTAACVIAAGVALELRRTM